jgi:hypothetical protein
LQFKKCSKTLISNIENLIKEGKQDDIEVRDLLKNFGLDVIGNVCSNLNYYNYLFLINVLYQFTKLNLEFVFE